MHILVIDDHILFRESLRYLIKDVEPSAVIVEASSAQEAVDAVSDYTDLNLILLDLHLADTHGLNILPTLRENAPTVPVAVLSAELDPGVIRQVLAAGAMGFVPKTAGGGEIASALRLILAGGIYQPSTQ